MNNLKKKDYIKLFFLSIFFNLFLGNFFIINYSLADFSTCSDIKNKGYLISQDDLKIDLIEIKINKYRKWTRNNIKILTSNSRYIDDKYKKRFKAKVKVIFSDKSHCTYKANIRQSGDAKDHISLEDDLISQSLDVSLEAGNIKGITNFKLFKKNARGNEEDNLILGQLLRDLGYLSPRSIKLNVKVNGAISEMLFQEKAAKEMLEYNKRREGPLLESDQKYFFNLVKNIPQNNLSNWSTGVPYLQNKTIKAMLARSTNGKLIEKNFTQKKIFFHTIDKLNKIYLYWGNRFKDNKNNYLFFDYDLDNNLLALQQEDQIIKLNIYNILLQATNSQHALSLSNRKFFWNGIENFFEPINYDSNVDIDLNKPTTTLAQIRYPISENFNESFEILEKKLNNININKFYNLLLINGFKEDIQFVQKKINKISENLRKLKLLYLENIKEEDVEHNKYKKLKNINDNLINTLKIIDPDVLIIAFDLKNYQLKKCELSLESCDDIYLNETQIIKLLNSNLQVNGRNTIFVGNLNESQSFADDLEFNVKKLDGSKIFFDNNTVVEIQDKERIINIDQKKPGSKVYIKGGLLKNFKINYKGYGLKNKNINPPDFPISQNNLTGCLSFINVEVHKLDISAINSTCEDTINFINVIGNIDLIDIKNSFMDALDADFSNLEFNEIKVNDAGNDCVDVSAGNYKIKRSKLINCGDKGLSVGEKAQVEINELEVNKSVTGIASKDSSSVITKLMRISNSKTCVASYNKKPEFLGAELIIRDLRCEDFVNFEEKDNYSKILIEKKSF